MTVRLGKREYIVKDLELLKAICEREMREAKEESRPSNTLIGFGKHKGAELHKLANSYLTWLIDNVKWIVLRNTYNLETEPANPSLRPKPQYKSAFSKPGKKNWVNAWWKN